MATKDNFERWSTDPDDPAIYAAEITPDDSGEFSFASRAVYIGEGGDLHVLMLNGDEATFMNVPEGSVLPIRITRVYETGTTASGVIPLW